MFAYPLSENCEAIFKKREHICFGISPFNSYFSEEKIRELALWGRREFQSMHFFVPDIPSIYTLEAQGYEKDKAEWKARRQAQYLKNKISRALGRLAFNNSEISGMILDWERLSNIESYQSQLERAHELFKEDLSFRMVCLQASKWVMEGKVPDASKLNESALLLAVKYFLAEVPLFTDTASIIEKNTSVFCYHQRVHFLELFFNGKLSHRPANHQGFIVVQSEDNNLNLNAAPFVGAEQTHG